MIPVTTSTPMAASRKYTNFFETGLGSVGVMSYTESALAVTPVGAAGGTSERVKL